MAAKIIEIIATFLSERNRFENADGDVVIATAWLNGSENREITIKVPADRDELKPEQTYLWSGQWVTHRRHGEQFVAQSFALKQPHSRQAVIHYLAAAGDGANANFGKARATKCWELFGEDAVRMLREQPADVAERLTAAGGVFRLTAKQAEAVAEVLRRDVALESVTIEVNGLLANRGFRRTLAKQVIRDYGAAASRKLRRNPFMLCGKYAGCGFKRCDAMWLSLKLPAAALKRQAYCAWHAIDSEKEGSTWVVRSVAEAAIRSSIGGAELQIDKAIRLAVRGGLLRECRTKGPNGPLSDDGNITWLACREHAENEEALATLVADAMEEPHAWPDVSSIANIDGEQPDVLRIALRGSIAILCGRPGTGKTFTAANLIKYLLGVFGHGTIGIGAPTNLAAQRLNQAMAAYGVAARARTNHSLLGKPRVRGQKWLHNATNPLPFKVLVFDEESMKDAEMACDIFRARAKGTMVLLIGDPNQLPPVGRGAPLRDLIAAGIPCGELKQIRRNSGGIVEACAAIAESRPWGAGDNLEIVPVDDEQGQQEAVIRKLTECKAAGFDPVWDSRILVAKNETRRGFNNLLQGHLNPNPAIDGVAFRVNDKVICRANEEFKIVSVDSNDDTNEVEYGDSPTLVRIANGELGRVLEIGDGFMHVQVEAPRRVVRVPLGPLAKPKADDEPDDAEKDKTGTGCCWDIAYAVTYHSSQGSEFPWPILVASSRDVNMGYRELPYTGISRGKNHVVLIGRKDIWDRFCRRVALAKRKTFLRERILREQARRELADL
jgi:exodeoxyribonuclease V alpha subunit